MRLPASLERVIHEFSKLPGIGPKSAQRLGLYLLKKDQAELRSFADSLTELKDHVRFCSTCHLMTQNDPCSICADPARDRHMLCVVEDSIDAMAIDRTHTFRGLFHILGGTLNPLEGIGPEQLFLRDIQARIITNEITEVIIATNPTLEGESTALHLRRLLENTGANITRIARGLPMGGDLEYVDDLTLSRAFEGRRQI